MGGGYPGVPGVPGDPIDYRIFSRPDRAKVWPRFPGGFDFIIIIIIIDSQERALSETMIFQLSFSSPTGIVHIARSLRYRKEPLEPP